MTGTKGLPRPALSWAWSSGPVVPEESRAGGPLEHPLTFQVHGSQPLHRQVRQEVLHPVEEEALAAAQQLLPLGLAAGQGLGGRAASQGQAPSGDECLKQRHPARSSLHPHSCTRPPAGPLLALTQGPWELVPAALGRRGGGPNLTGCGSGKCWRDTSQTPSTLSPRGHPQDLPRWTGCRTLSRAPLGARSSAVKRDKDNDALIQAPRVRCREVRGSQDRMGAQTGGA